MFRKLLFGAVALTGLFFAQTQSADAFHRRYRGGYYNNGPYGGYYYAPRRAFRQRYYSNYSYPGYYNNGYGYAPGSYYYTPYYGSSYYYGPGVGVTTPGFGFYIQ